MQNKYDFRKELDQVHKPDRRDPEATPAAGEVVIDERWVIAVEEAAPALTARAAADLQDYLWTSMGLSLPIRRGACSGAKAIRLGEQPMEAESPRAFVYTCGPDGIAISGAGPRGTAQGGYYLEDLMNLREAPFLEPTAGPVLRRPLFSPRMTHSGWGLDLFPDTQLNAIAHAGFDTILLYAKGVDVTTFGNTDFNDVIRRAEAFGLDTYFYSYLNSFKHPDDPDAEAFFDRQFGSLFQACPGARGLILVGESCQFPSKDPATSGRMADYGNAENAGLADPRPAPGWWPCKDYPQWLNAVKKAVRRHQPAADVVFWTYNWGRAPEQPRLELIRALPADITLLVTFEMFHFLEKENYTALVPDYTITFPGPGRYFSSEAREAKARGLRLFTMSNTGGMTWDLGVMPYIPTPQQWFKRFEALHRARRDWGLSGLMESHHYGWYPSPVCECAKWSFWEPGADVGERLERIAIREFGARAAPLAVAAWQRWSDAIASYTPGFDDQAGPLRVGPAYPLIFQPCLYPLAEQKMKFPDRPGVHNGARILHPMYYPEHLYGHTASGRRFHEELPVFEKAVAMWEEGNALMDRALALAPARKREAAGGLAGTGKFFGCGLRTCWHVKRWWLLNKRLEIEPDFARAEAILDELEAIARAEKKNVEAALPLAEADSRLGWEPSMDYMADPWHLRWKLRQLDTLVRYTLKAYRTTLQKRPPIDPFSETGVSPTNSK